MKRIKNKISGAIYILVNDSIPDYVKIEYSENIYEKLNELNNNKIIPRPYYVYKYCNVNKPMNNVRIHKIIYDLEPNLLPANESSAIRMQRDFYKISKEKARQILEKIGPTSSFSKNSIVPNMNKIWNEYEENFYIDKEESEDPKITRKFSRKRYLPRMDEMIKHELLKINDELCTILKPKEIATIIDEKNVNYNGKIMTLNRFAETIYSHVKSICAYKYVRKVGSKETLHELREKWMNGLGIKHFKKEN